MQNVQYLKTQNKNIVYRPLLSSFTSPSEPDSPPHNLVVLNSTSSTATITWSPPNKPNGIILFYEVTYSNATFSYTVNSTIPSITLQHLKPFTLYNVTARGYTWLGHGDQTSLMLQMLSGEDGGSFTLKEIISEYVLSRCVFFLHPSTASICTVFAFKPLLIIIDVVKLLDKKR